MSGVTVTLEVCVSCAEFDESTGQLLVLESGPRRSAVSSTPVYKDRAHASYSCPSARPCRQ